MLNVVIFNGGRGAKNLIPVLLDSESMYVTSIVNAYDDGKSTGEIRDLFRMLGPSDLRKVQELMLPSGSVDSRVIKELFAYRLPVGCQRNEVLAALGRFAVGETSQDLLHLRVRLGRCRAGRHMQGHPTHAHRSPSSNTLGSLR